MSFFRKLFGGGGETAASEPEVAGEAEHRGFVIKATPFKQDGQYQTCGIISKEVGGEMKEHRFIRADRFAGLDDVVQLTLSKGRQIIDEQGERLFG
ncbi:MAG: HlyU family transcriptional regulator [Rhizobiaceae bacterium]|nr:HlyU family transcriptional regulator [Rhizobiaceae bacterium]